MNILKDKFVEGVTLQLVARAAGLKVPRSYSERDERAQLLRLVYEHETGRNAEALFTSGLGRAQWEYGIRGTDYWPKHKREAVLAYMTSIEH